MVDSARIATSGSPRPERADASPGTQSRRRELATLAAIVFLALLLRAWGIDTQSFSMDEVSELSFAHHGIPQIVVTNDGFPPLYSILLHLWLGVFGRDAAARWLSVLAGTLAVFPLWSLGRRAGGAAVAAGAALVLACSPIHVWYSQEARAYALYFLLAAVAVAQFARALDGDRAGDWRRYTLVAVAGLYTHYYFGLLIAVNLLVAIVERRTWRALRPAIVAHAWMVPFCVPLLPLLAGDLSFQEAEPLRASRFSPVAAAYTYFTLIAGFAVGPSTSALHTLSVRDALMRSVGWGLLAGVAAVTLALAGARRLGGRWTWRVAILAVAPVVLCGLAAVGVGLGYRVRHIVWVAIPIQLLFGAGVACVRRSRVAAIGGIALAALSAVSLVNHQRVASYMTEDVRTTAAWLARRSTAEMPIVVMSGYMTGPLGYYLRGPWRMVPLPRAGEAVGFARAIAAIRAAAPPGRPFWFVYSRPFDGDPAGRLRTALVERAGLELAASFPGVELYRATGF
jgi:mannosyltransferase